MSSGFPARWQDCGRFINGSREAGILLEFGIISFLDLLHRVGRTEMPFQLELDEVPPNTAHANCSVELMLHDDFARASVLERCNDFAEYLTRLTVRSVVDLEQALDL